MRIWTATVRAFQRCSVERSSLITDLFAFNYPRNIFPKPAYRQPRASIYPLIHISLRKRTFHAKRCHCSPVQPDRASADFIYFKSNGGRNLPFIMSTPILVYGSTELLYSFHLPCDILPTTELSAIQSPTVWMS